MNLSLKYPSLAKDSFIFKGRSLKSEIGHICLPFVTNPAGIYKPFTVLPAVTIE